MPGRPFEKGRSGNAGGRPRALERLVRDIVGDDMVAIIKAQIAIATGQKPKDEKLQDIDLPAIKAADMTKAAEWLGDRGWGKARQTVEVGPEVNVDDLDMAKLNGDQLNDLIAKLEAEVAAAEEEEPGDNASSSDADPPQA